MTVVSVLLPGAALVREKERGTVEQLLVSPLSPFQVLFSKVLAMTLVILVGSAVSLYAVMGPAFGVPVRGSAILFFALTALYVFTTAGLGLLAATGFVVAMWPQAYAVLSLRDFRRGTSSACFKTATSC